MKDAIRRIGLTVLTTGLVMVLVLPLAAHAQGRPSGGGTSSGAASSGSTGSTANSRGASGGVSAASSYYSAPTRNVGGSYASSPGGGISTSSVPRIPAGSSFTNYNYYRFLNFSNWLGMNYSWFQLMQFGLWDMHRFYVNREPLITPQMVHLTLSSPLAASERLLAEVDALQALVDDTQAGKPVTKEQVSAKTQEIRGLAKRIRSCQPLAFFDLGKRQDVTKGVDKLGLGAISQLRQMALELNSQLKGMYNQTVTSTVSVNSLNQASFESLSKGIEKLSKVIENAKPRS